MIFTPRLMRSLVFGAAILALASVSTGCRWFKHKPASYTTSSESRPIEVPPDLDLPDTSTATTLPPAGGLGSVQRPIPASAEIRLTDPAAAAYPRVGTALEGIPGVVINGRAEALGSYDVTYQAQNFLIRVQDSAAGGSRLLALSPDGRLLGTGPAAELMSAIKAKL